MASKRQIEANRENAKKCTGPKSAEGKSISSQNALKTGLDAKSEVLRFESRPDYEALIAEFYTRYRPTVPEDRALVDMLIRSEWLLRRYTAIDTAIWEHDFYETGEKSLGATFLKSEQAFERVGKRMNWAQRNFQFALKQLFDIRAKRTTEPEPETQPTPEPPNPEPAETIETEPPNPKLVSFLPPTQATQETTENRPSPNPKSEENPPAAA